MSQLILPEDMENVEFKEEEIPTDPNTDVPVIEIKEDEIIIEDVKEELLSLPMPDVNAIVNFYIALVKRLAQLSQTFSLRLIKKAKKKMTKEEYEGLKKEIKTLYQTLQSFPSS